MSSSTPKLDLISSSQAQKEVAANDLFLSASPSTAFARRRLTSTGLTWGYYGTHYRITDGSFIDIANGTLTLEDDATNYVEVEKATGDISVNQTGFTAGGDFTPIYSIVTAGGVPTSWIDARQIIGEGIQGPPGPSGSGYAVVTSITASTTLDNATHAGKFLECAHASVPIVLTVSPDSSGLWDDDVEVHLRWSGVAAVSVAAGSGVTIQQPATKTLDLAEKYSAATLKRVAANTWALFGDLDLV